ncbi:MAG TPA: hypothetical protein VFQ54_08845 [Thermomicrobiales bacterium]|nr:hypothetical protein [Thermomicrobiales bacterium]
MSDPKSTSETIVDWVGDIVAVESHIEEALDHQLRLTPGSRDVAEMITQFHDTVRDSKKRAVAYQETIGTTSGNGVIKKGSELLGKAAGMIDRIRKDSPTKSLRDDYVAFNLAAISYSLLQTTALALDDQKTQAFAEEGLATYAKLVLKLNAIVARAVVDDLITNSEVQVADPDVVSESSATIARIWQEAAN